MISATPHQRGLLDKNASREKKGKEQRKPHKKRRTPILFHRERAQLGEGIKRTPESYTTNQKKPDIPNSPDGGVGL